MRKCNALLTLQIECIAPYQLRFFSLLTQQQTADPATKPWSALFALT
jgi:hypothetical protein